MSKQTLGFQAEVRQLLNLMIHSLYSNKEIFLRELISNASDAADKLRFEALSNSSLYESDPELKINVSFDKTERTITIRDNGIGMSREEVVDNIGTIARSGTKAFLANLSGDQAKDANLIGQFGVGFYSAFIIADKVTLRTRRAGSPVNQGIEWQSAGEGDFTIEEISRPERGTEVVLHLREGEDEFLSSWRLESVIKHYSDHINLPIILQKEVHKTEKDAEGKDQDITEISDETVNQASALWTRAKSEITSEQYEEFYKHVGHDFQGPLTYVHSKVEGKQEYTILLYIPQHAPFDLYDRESRQGVKLYIKRVFIMEDNDKKLLPFYLRFVRGVIDSNDLPLNVSREILQDSKDVSAIRAGSVKKVLGSLEDLAKNDPEKYKTFWKEFGRVFKEGIGEDFANKERIAKLCRFASTQLDTDEPAVSLEEYIGRMQEGQEKIYYITAESFASAKNSPHLEIFRKKGIEVLLLADRVDEWVVSSLTEFQGKLLQSVSKGELDLGQLEDEEDKKVQEKEQEDHKTLLEKMKTSLGDKVKEVRVTHRLTSSPACLVTDTHDMGMNLERLLKAAGQEVNGTKPILEINLQHSLIQKLEAAADHFDDWTQIVFDQAVLSEGGQLDDPAGFVHKLNKLILSQ